jgi:hypothetical protein
MKFASNVKFGGQVYNAGMEVPKEMDKETIASLQESGAIETPKSKSDAKRLAELEKANADTDENTQDDTTEDTGLPVNMDNTKVEVVEYARSKGIAVDESKTKKEILETLKNQ